MKIQITKFYSSIQDYPKIGDLILINDFGVKIMVVLECETTEDVGWINLTLEDSCINWGDLTEEEKLIYLNTLGSKDLT